ncbi:hypothetical protein ACLQ9R_01355 [Bordetella hinzii]|uniref:Uncharacterized protein n=1 Tax=Bordetella hinzii TaxID=103855 RepID=A0AAN1S142_9BORD|nr:hypothetical protein [Bordetella hinzii]AKQ59715.1 hypothetical protein ACR55_01845 [Bordetella hinzii]AZW19162.1 hypothetical protein CS347_21575 [Bordetella hinzii]
MIVYESGPVNADFVLGEIVYQFILRRDPPNAPEQHRAKVAIKREKMGSLQVNAVPFSPFKVMV